MKRPPGLIGTLGLFDYGGKLHIANPQLLDWHHERVTAYCGREWPLPPKSTHTWPNVEEDEVCKTCLQSSRVAEFVVREKHERLWKRFLRR